MVSQSAKKLDSGYSICVSRPLSDVRRHHAPDYPQAMEPGHPFKKQQSEAKALLCSNPVANDDHNSQLEHSGDFKNIIRCSR
jgi:hypothetical protein